MYEVFVNLSDGGKIPLDKNTFRKGLGLLSQAGLKNLDGSPFVDRLFLMLDINKDGTIDLQEFVTGLSLLCKGTPEEKLKRKFYSLCLNILANIFLSFLQSLRH